MTKGGPSGYVAAGLLGVLVVAAAFASIVPASTGPTVVTFEVAGYADETYKIELATPELIEHVQQIMAGEDVALIPNGLVVRDDPSVNAPWSWHIDPASLSFADVDDRGVRRPAVVRRGRRQSPRPTSAPGSPR